MTVVVVVVLVTVEIITAVIIVTAEVARTSLADQLFQNEFRFVVRG